MNQKDDNQRVVSKTLFKTEFDDQEKKKYEDITGGRIIDPGKKEEEKEPPKPPFYEKFLNKKTAMIAAGIVVAFGIASFFIFSGKPKPVAEDYIKAVTTGDYAKAYQYLDVKDQPTLGNAAYLKHVEFARNSKEDSIYKLSQNDIKSVELIEGAEKNSSITFDADIVLKKNNAEENHKYTMSLQKKKTGPFGMFTGYKIAGDGIYAIPKINCLTGTEQITIDGVNLAGNKEKLRIDKPIFYGWHDVECKGKFYDSFKDRALFDKDSGMLKLNGKKFKLNSACNEAVTGASKEFVAAFFPATLTDNGYKECKTLPNEKSIDEMYKNFGDGFKEVGVSSVKINDGKLISSFAGDNGNIHCQYEYVGVYESNGQQERECNGVVNLEYISDNGNLIVAKVNDYNIHLKD